MTKTAREIIKNINVGNFKEGDVALGSIVDDKEITEVLTAFRKLIKEERPEYLEFLQLGHPYLKNIHKIDGRNITLREYDDHIDEVMK